MMSSTATVSKTADAAVRVAVILAPDRSLRPGDKHQHTERLENRFGHAPFKMVTDYVSLDQCRDTNICSPTIRKNKNLKK